MNGQALVYEDMRDNFQYIVSGSVKTSLERLITLERDIAVRRERRSGVRVPSKGVERLAPKDRILRAPVPAKGRPHDREDLSELPGRNEQGMGEDSAGRSGSRSVDLSGLRNADPG